MSLFKKKISAHYDFKRYKIVRKNFLFEILYFINNQLHGFFIVVVVVPFFYVLFGATIALNDIDFGIAEKND